MDQATQQRLMNAEKLRREVNELLSKGTELEVESNEHGLVIDTIKDLDKQRKCFRLIGGVLVEQTVGEVLPAITENKKNIDTFIDRLRTEASKKEKLADEIYTKFKEENATGTVTS